jgi:hypothetical protein
VVAGRWAVACRDARWQAVASSPAARLVSSVQRRALVSSIISFKKDF